VAGALLGEAAPAHYAALEAYGTALGAAFQIADDLLDAEGSEGRTGKAVAKDRAAGKATFVTVLGVEGARDWLARLHTEALAALAPFGDRGRTLAEAVDFVVRRDR
jgi:farnesyl diphosphate synthase